MARVVLLLYVGPTGTDTTVYGTLGEMLMARSLVLLVSAHPQRLRAHHSVIQAAGQWLTVPAATLERAFTLLDTIRPALVVYDAADADGLAQPLHQSLHGCALHANVHLLLLGAVPPERHPARVGEPCSHCTSCPHCAQIYPTTEGEDLITLLTHVLAGTDGEEKYPSAGDGMVDGAEAERLLRDAHEGPWLH